MAYKLFYIQPIITSYRKNLVAHFSREYDLTVLSGTPHDKSGFLTPTTSKVNVIKCQHTSLFGGRILMQSGVINAILETKPDIVLTCANIRDLTYWRILFLCRKLDIKVYSHGQGLYSKKHPKFFIKLLYRTAIKLSHRYICYTSLSRNSLITAGCPASKLEVADNSIEFTTSAVLHSKSGTEEGVLFIGRLREHCGLEDLITSLQKLRLAHPELILHIIGSGELEKKYREAYSDSWVVFHGAIYEDSKILDISKTCRIGCYPGDAGLSVVHYFSLRLPPIVHNDIFSHMGPEPSYIQDGINGITFCKKQGPSGISQAVDKIWKMSRSEYLKISDAAYATYESLNNPTMEFKMLKILNSHNSKDK